MQKRLIDILANLDIAQIIISHDNEFISKIVDKIYYLTSLGLKALKADKDSYWPIFFIEVFSI